MDQPVTNQPEFKPKPKNNWWSLGLGLVAVILGPGLGIFANRQNNQPDGQSASASMPNLGIFSLLLAAAALVTSIMAIKKGQRTPAVWAGLGLGILALGYFAYIAISELVGS